MQKQTESIDDMIGKQNALAKTVEEQFAYRFALTFNNTNKAEKKAIYNVLLDAIEWGKKV